MKINSCSKVKERMPPSGILWPRQDILALVLPQIATCGRQLTTALTVSVMKLLRKYQTPEGKISFEKWLITAKDRLKWNDSCIKLFWDMLKLIIWYSNNYNNYNTDEDYGRGDLVDVEYLVIYLVLHIPDNTLIQRPSSPTIGSHYDTVWPSTNNLFMDTVESNMGLTSPVKEKSNSFASIAPTSPNATNNLSIKIPGTSSPTSPTQSRSTSPTSPKRNQSLHSYSQRQSKLSSTQYLYLLKVKINIILIILQDENVVSSSLSSPNDNYTDNSSSNNSDQSISLISRRTIDNLGLILGGGENREDLYSSDAFYLSCLHPKYQTLSKTYESSEMTDGISPPLLSSEVFSWIDSMLSVNEFIYPVHSNHSNSSSPKNTKNGDLFSSDKSAGGGSTNSLDNSENVSSRIFIPYKSLGRCRPTVISNSHSSTIMHIVENFPNRSGDSNFYDTSHSVMSRSTTGGTNTTNKMNTTTNMALSSMSVSTSNSSFEALDQFDDMRSSLEKTDMDEKYSDSDNQRIMKLPSLNVYNCSNTTLYMLSPYFSAVISGCSDVEIIIGSVAGALTVTGCERVKITVACRKLLVNNCLECSFNVATLSPSIVLGDSRSLIIGPYNLSYKHSQNYIAAANLSQLCHGNPDILSGNQGVTNYWANLCDLNLCLEAAVTAGSPTGYAIDAAADLSLPMPNSATVTLLPTTKFFCATIPYKESLPSSTSAIVMDSTSIIGVSELDYLCIPLPEGYKREYFDNFKTINFVSSKLASIGGSGGGSPTVVDVVCDNDVKEQMPINDFISKKFLEWIVSSGHSQEVVNLVQLDATSAQKGSQTNKKL